MSNPNENFRVIHIDDLPMGGFAGIVEQQMVLSPDLWPKAQHRTDISHGIGDFVYLANGYFKPNDGAPLHPHNDVDIVSVILNGSVGHEGTLGDGTIIEGPGVQVQRAGTGMQHSEFSTQDKKADFVQIWFRPPASGLKPGYQNIKLEPNTLTTVLGGNDPQCFDSTMTVRAGYLAKDESLITDRPFIALITEGHAMVNNVRVQKGDLIEGEQAHLTSDEMFGLVLIQHNEPM